MKHQLVELWETHFVCYPAGDTKELEKFVERLKRAHPSETGGDLLARIKKSSGPLFSKAGEESGEDLECIFDALERSSSDKVRFFKVVFKPRVVLRALPSTTAAMICTKRHGETLAALELRDGWIRCREGTRDCWALIDGTDLGHGKLLEEIKTSPPPAAPAAPRPGGKAPEGGYPRQFKVAGRKGALLRKTADLDSPRVKPNLDYDTVCMVSEELVLADGTRRLHVVSPVDGWCSEKVMAFF